MTIKRTYKGLVETVDMNMNQRDMHFLISVEIGLLTYILNFRTIKDYMMNCIENDVRAIVYGYDYEILQKQKTKEIQNAISISLKRSLPMYKDVRLKSLRIEFSSLKYK